MTAKKKKEKIYGRVSTEHYTSIHTSVYMYLGEAEMLSLLFSTRVFWSFGATKEFQSI
jgi:hypothetical protein